jgi:predicted RNA-binding Zn ribbon-like protein
MSWTFDLCGDHLALDFANSVSHRETDAPIERLTDYSDLVAFVSQSQVIDRARARSLLAMARRHPGRADAALAQAVALRDGLYQLFRAVALGDEARPENVDLLNAEMGRLCVAADLTLAWRDEPRQIDAFLGAIVLAAVRLATDPSERSRVRVCEAPDCEWLFYDTSKNRSRRWCDMRQCGNRMKARRHYQRARHQNR